MTAIHSSAVRRLALIVLLGAVLAGCGGEDTVSPTPETIEGMLAGRMTLRILASDLGVPFTSWFSS